MLEFFLTGLGFTAVALVAVIWWAIREPEVFNDEPADHHAKRQGGRRK